MYKFRIKFDQNEKEKPYILERRGLVFWHSICEVVREPGREAYPVARGFETYEKAFEFAERLAEDEYRRIDERRVKPKLIREFEL